MLIGFVQGYEELKEQSRQCVSKLTSADVRLATGVFTATSLVNVTNFV